MLMNQDTLRQQRAQQALYLDAASHQPSDTGKLIADMQPTEDGDSSAGGVDLEPQHLLDQQEPMDGSMAKPTDQGDKEADDDLIDLTGSGPPSPARKVDLEFPTLGQAAAVKGKKKQSNVIEGLSTLGLNDSRSSRRWDTKLSSDAKAPKGQGTGVTMVDYREAIVTGPGGVQKLIATDWDHRVFERHAVDGLYHCPFTRCR